MPLYGGRRVIIYGLFNRFFGEELALEKMQSYCVLAGLGPVAASA